MRQGGPTMPGCDVGSGVGLDCGGGGGLLGELLPPLPGGAGEFCVLPPGGAGVLAGGAGVLAGGAGVLAGGAGLFWFWLLLPLPGGRGPGGFARAAPGSRAMARRRTRMIRCGDADLSLER